MSTTRPITAEQIEHAKKILARAEQGKAEQDKAERERWEPRRYGPGRQYYCSPGCGGSAGPCTWAEHERQRHLGERLAARLRESFPGVEWDVQMHENMRWYVKVCSKDGHITVRPAGSAWHKRQEHHAYISRIPHSSGVDWAADHRVPEQAILTAVKACYQYTQDVLRSMAMLQGTMQYIEGDLRRKRRKVS